MSIRLKKQMPIFSRLCLCVVLTFAATTFTHAQHAPEMLPTDAPASETERLTVINSQHARQREAEQPQLKPSQGQLRLATCQFPESADIHANGQWIQRQLRYAKSQGAELVHFPECALSGYPGSDMKTLENFDWDLLHKETDAILALVRELRVWVVLGSVHRLSAGHKPHNSLYVIDPLGRIVDRYDKRFCTGEDLRYFSPGDHFVVFDVNGIRCGLLICYDLRFPELYRQYSKLGAQLILHSFYNARQERDDIHPKIIPLTGQAMAGANHMYVSLSNVSTPHSWQSRFITPDGLVACELSLDEPGVMVNLIDTSRSFYDATCAFRHDYIEGKLHSGDLVDDPRSRKRTSY